MKTYADWQGPLGQSFGRGSLPKGRYGMRDPGRRARPWSHPAHLPGLGEHAGGAHVVRRRTLVNARGGSLTPDGGGITDQLIMFSLP